MDLKNNQKKTRNKWSNARTEEKHHKKHFLGAGGFIFRWFLFHLLFCYPPNPLGSHLPRAIWRLFSMRSGAPPNALQGSSGRCSLAGWWQLCWGVEAKADGCVPWIPADNSGGSMHSNTLFGCRGETKTKKMLAWKLDVFFFHSISPIYDLTVIYDC